MPTRDPITTSPMTAVRSGYDVATARSAPSMLIPISLLLIACTASDKDPTVDDTDQDVPPSPQEFHGLTCTAPTSWDPSDPAPQEPWDFLFAHLDSPIVIPPDGDLMDQCISRNDAGAWTPCQKIYTERGFSVEDFRAAVAVAYGDPLTPIEATLDDVIQRCLLPEQPLEPDADIEIERHGWYHNQFGVQQLACPDVDVPGRWGGGGEGVMVVALDLGVDGCQADIEAKGWPITTSPETSSPVAWIPNLVVTYSFSGTWAAVEAVR